MTALKKQNTPKDDIQTALRVIETEIQGLKELTEAINDEFSNAIDKIHTMKQHGQNGRLIIAGIGKSGHVARKIAATMASTGTPAYYVHPGEASHGDLGMVTNNDVVLILSNSGENSELSDLIHYTQRYGIILIAMTSNPQSTLSQHSDINLIIPKSQEACPNGLAPTTSTTIMMALGDALSVALLNRTGLTPDQFKKFHPGGKLGQQLLTVENLMIPFADIAKIDKTATMDEAILKLTETNQGAVIIIDKNKVLEGIVTDGDLKRHMAPDLLQKPVSEVMSTSPKTILPGELAAKALDIMTKTPGKYLTSLIVTSEEGTIKGLIRLQDCLQAGVQ